MNYGKLKKTFIKKENRKNMKTDTLSVKYNSLKEAAEIKTIYLKSSISRCCKRTTKKNICWILHGKIYLRKFQSKKTYLMQLRIMALK